MRANKYLANGLIGLTAVVGAAGYFARNGEGERVASTPGTYITAAVAEAAPAPAAPKAEVATGTAAEVNVALNALAATVKVKSDPRALETAFRSYYAYKAAHPDEVKKPFLYYVDYGLAATEKRGYVFDMDKLTVVEGPFTVAHGRGSSTTKYGVPTRFANASGSASTSLGLYVAKSTYSFTGHAGGVAYSALGMRLMGVSKGWNDLAFMRGVVAHGAPYVTADRAGRSEGCPAMEVARAQRLLPKLANGGVVFLFAPNEKWMQDDQWVNAG